MAVPVNVENLVRAESDRTFAALQAEAGGVNRLRHNRAPVPIEHQPAGTPRSASTGRRPEVLDGSWTSPAVEPG